LAEDQRVKAIAAYARAHSIQPDVFSLEGVVEANLSLKRSTEAFRLAKRVCTYTISTSNNNSKYYYFYLGRNNHTVGLASSSKESTRIGGSRNGVSVWTSPHRAGAQLRIYLVFLIDMKKFSALLRLFTIHDICLSIFFSNHV
jgi:hypothetical protein